MAFDKDAGMTANNSESPIARDAWVKPEILSFEPVAAAQGSGSLTGEALNNAS
ncbi:hypothetical protein QH494_09385 [Sphingomonas sp. AR_OL41]|jgi:hypothetical protein|uniref:hypothetical protein n=1 Tax=Parasphingomonas halimpatiens TaxID=3096162 RepID=UPI0024806288|nr:hypothetical protein [Sphingomonas sp. AR_OL41]MDH7972393.1 hypothetical protein [Sphingomonas sp. AR_OL41]